MSETAVLFRSKYGASRKYALMLKERIGADAIENENMKPELIRDFSNIVIIGGVYRDRINGLDFIRRFRRDLLDKNIFVFAVGCMEFSTEYIARLRRVNGLDDIPLFYGRGEMDLRTLSFADRFMINAIRKMAGRRTPEELTDIEKTVIEAAGGASWVDGRYLDPIVDYLS